MKVTYSGTLNPTLGLERYPCDILLIGVTGPLDEHHIFRTLDSERSGVLTSLAALSDFQAKPGQLFLHPTPTSDHKLTLFFGLGSTVEDQRKAFSTALTKAKSLKGKAVVIASVTRPDDSVDAVAAIYEVLGETIAAENHNPKTYKTEKSGYTAPQQFETVKIVGPKSHFPAMQNGVERGLVIGNAVNFARDLAGEPANIITPSAFRDLAQRVQAETRTTGAITCQAFDDRWMTEQNANGILMVAKGSAEKPWLIQLTYTPKVATEASLDLIGKTVTFDSGGYDIKTSGMREMKRDKTGGANVLAAFQAIATLNLPIKVRAYFAATENMISGGACRPGDVFTTMSGRTIEIGNTDAEGRLTLVEALEYAQRQGAKFIVDMATLTGAAKQVGGDVAPLAYGNDNLFSAKVVEAADTVGESISLQPMLEAVRKYNESPIADVCNLPAAKGAGSMAAAWFIREWLWPDVSWVHMDIANVAWKNDRATGHSVRTLIQLARKMAAAPAAA
ncbi:MAG TPA: leucyl aminopeptidase family protein [Oculatellaceae cyanobacterium]